MRKITVDKGDVVMVPKRPLVPWNQKDARKLEALAQIAELMDGTEWSADTLDEIAATLRAAGFQIRDVDVEED